MMGLSLSHFSSLIVIAGISGAGRSSALHRIADLGFYAIDNIPVNLIPSFIEQTKGYPRKYRFTVMTVDLHASSNVKEFLAMVDSMEHPEKLSIVFLDSDTEILLKRYTETRRPHPDYSPHRDISLEDTILRERERLMPLRHRAHFVLDTSALTIHDLRRELGNFVESLESHPQRTVRVNILSFGFKHGVPRDCDIIMDVRFLPNPFFVAELRDKTGLEKEVSEYVLLHPDSKEFVERFSSLLQFLLPKYQFEGKAYVKIGIGCTGGKHRSVAIAELLAQTVALEGFVFSTKHRDLQKK